jgi:hypothetical protein
MKARFIQQIGIHGQLRIYWDKVRGEKPYEGGYTPLKYLDDCPRCYGKDSRGIHNAYEPLGDKLGTEDWNCFGKEEDYLPEQWPQVCAHCSAPVPKDWKKPTKEGEEGIYLVQQVFTSRLYNTASGKPEAGDVFYVKIHDPNECHYWDSCSGAHLHGICPSGEEWDIDSRASNCTMKDDKKHRCWVRVGSPENGTIHIDKNGLTCAAGAGSILLSNWHGYLHHGEWHT